MASLFLILIYSIRRCKREKKNLEFKIRVQDWVVTQGDKIKIIPEVSGIISWKNIYIFELEYEIEAKFHNTKKKNKRKIRWGPASLEKPFFLESLEECDSYVLRLTSVAWEDLTGVCKVKKKLEDEINILVMPVIYSLEMMNEKIKRMDLYEQGSDYDGIRSYRESDRFSRIHWNLYASTRQLWVRKNENDTEDCVRLALDLSMIEKDRFNDYFSVFYSVSMFYMQFHVIQEIYYGDQMFMLSDIEQYEELFTDIFCEGIQKLTADVSEIQLIELDDKERNIQKYLYDMEL